MSPPPQAAIEATKTVIDTLGPSDAIQIIDFDSDAVSHTETCMTTMVPATDDNKKKLKEFAGRMRADGGTSFASAFRKADAILRDEVSIKVIGDKPTMVLFMSDGQATREHYPETLRSWKQLANVPTVLAFGFGQGAKMDALDEIVQINTGDSSSVAKKVDENDIRTSMASYYQHPSLAHRNSDNTELHVAMTAPYWDFSGIGLVVTISIPLYDQAGKLWGVAGVDVSMGDLVLPVKGMRYGMQGYSFLMDTSRGSALSHPLVPSSTGESQPVFYAEDLESNRDFRESVLPLVMRPQGNTRARRGQHGINATNNTAHPYGPLTSGETGSNMTTATTTAPGAKKKKTKTKKKQENTAGEAGEVRSGLAQVTMSHGGATDGMTFKYDQQATYHFKTLDDLPIAVIVVLFAGDDTFRFDPRVPGADSHAKAIELNGRTQYGQRVNVLTASRGLASPAVCSMDQTDENAVLQVMRTDTTTVNLAAPAFTHPQGYLELTETLDTTHSVEEYLNGKAGVEFSFAGQLTNEQLAFDAYGTSYLDKIFKKSFDDNDWNIGIYIGTATGEFRKFPGGVHKKDYDPVVRPWYKRAIAYPGKAVLSAPYTDASGAGTVVTLSKTIHARGGAPGSRIIGVVGLDFKLEHVQSLMMTGDAPAGVPAPAEHCAIIDDSLKVVVTDSPSWQPNACSGLANRWDKCFDPTSSCWAGALAQRSRLSVCDKLGDNVAQAHYALEETAEEASTSLARDGISVKRIPGTNTFLAHTKGTDPGTDPKLTEPLQFHGDCAAKFRGVPPRKAGATPLCAAAAASPVIQPPAVDSRTHSSIRACPTRGATAAQSTAGGGGGLVCLGGTDVVEAGGTTGVPAAGSSVNINPVWLSLLGAASSLLL